jgi:hypothetical protein
MGMQTIIDLSQSCELPPPLPPLTFHSYHPCGSRRVYWMTHLRRAVQNFASTEPQTD